MNVCKTMIMLFQILHVNYAFQVEKDMTKNVDTINFTVKVIQLLLNIILTVLALRLHVVKNIRFLMRLRNRPGNIII